MKSSSIHIHMYTLLAPLNARLFLFIKFLNFLNCVFKRLVELLRLWTCHFSASLYAPAIGHSEQVDDGCEDETKRERPVGHF